MSTKKHVSKETQNNTSSDTLPLEENGFYDTLTHGSSDIPEGIYVSQFSSSNNHSLSKITPEAISRYKTTSDSYLIGAGGMGRVIRVFDTHLGRNIARKELHHSLTKQKSRGGPSIQQRFLREARITAQLEHPGIVPVYEVGENEDGTL